MSDPAAYAMDWLQKRGYTPPQAAALVGHATQESGLNPSAVGDDGTAKGLFQWRGDRLTGLQSFAKATGRDPSAIDTQLSYMDHELNTTEAKAGAMLRAATTVPDAVNAGMAYERPQGYTPDNPEGGHGYGNRLGEAMRLAGMPAGSGAAPMAQTLQPASFAAAPQTLASAFVPPVEDTFARQRAVAAAKDAENRKALLGGGGIAGLYA